MKTLQIELPEKVAQELDKMVQVGWFTNQKEIIQFALWEFIRHDFSLTEQFQREDIAWALQQKEQTQ